MEQIEWRVGPSSLILKESEVYLEVRNAGFVIDTRGIRPILVKGIFAYECATIEEALTLALAWIMHHASV